MPAGAVLPRDKRNFHGSALNVSNQIWPLLVQSASQSLWRFQYQPSSGPSETAIFEEELTRRWAEDNRLLACVPHCHVSWIYNIYIYIFIYLFTCLFIFLFIYCVFIYLFIFIYLLFDWLIYLFIYYNYMHGLLCPHIRSLDISNGSKFWIGYYINLIDVDLWHFCIHSRNFEPLPI